MFQAKMGAAGNVCDFITIKDGIHGMGGPESGEAITNAALIQNVSSS